MLSLAAKNVSAKKLQSCDNVEIADIKRKFERELAQGEILNRELKVKLIRLRRENESAKQRVDSKRDNLVKLKVKFIEMEQSIQSFDESVKRVISITDSFKQGVAEDLYMAEFQEEVMRLVNTYSDASQFYSEDRLTLELKNKEKSLNERRVAITKIDEMVSRKREQVEQKKAEIQAEIERKQKEEIARQLKIKEELANRQLAEQFNIKLDNSSNFASEKPFVRPFTPRCENYGSSSKTPTPTSLAVVDKGKKDFDEDSFSLSQSFDNMLKALSK